MIMRIESWQIFEVLKAPLRQWQGIIFHCTANNPGSEYSQTHLMGSTIDADHRKPEADGGRGFNNGMGYQFLINRMDGIIETGDRWLEQLDGAHCPEDGKNHTHIGISFVGNGDIEKPTMEQMKSLKALFDELRKKLGFGIFNVFFHRDFDTHGKTCPGNLLNLKIIRKYLGGLNESYL